MINKGQKLIIPSIDTMITQKQAQQLYKKITSKTDKDTITAILYTNRTAKEVLELRTNEATQELKDLIDEPAGNTYLIETDTDTPHAQANFTRSLKKAGTSTATIKELADYLDKHAIYYKVKKTDLIKKLKPVMLY